MTVREIQGVQNPVTSYARGLGWYSQRMRYLGPRGCPDTWFFRAGIAVICEWKRAGEEPTVQQRLRHAELRKAGFEVHVIDSADAGRALFDQLEQEHFGDL